MSSSQPEKTSSAEPTFEQALERLEAIVRDLEEGQIGLAVGLARYEEGIQLLRQCYQLLDHAQRRIELLNRVDLDGQEECEPFDESTTSLEEKARQRSRRRSRQAPAEPDPVEDEMDGPGRLF